MGQYSSAIVPALKPFSIMFCQVSCLEVKIDRFMTVWFMVYFVLLIGCTVFLGPSVLHYFTQVPSNILERNVQHSHIGLQQPISIVISNKSICSCSKVAAAKLMPVS